jgi:hypothetical protein
MASTSARIATRAFGFLSNRVVSRLLKLAITAIVLTIAARYIQPAKLFSTLLSVQPAFLMFAVIMLIPNLYLQQVKWLLLLRRIDSNATSIAAWYSLLAGYPLGLTTPGRWGELGRAIFFPDYPRTTIAALAAMDKVMNLAAIVLLGIIGVASFSHDEILPVFSIRPAFMMAIVFIFLVGLLFSARIMKKFVNRDVVRDPSSSWRAVLQNFDARFLLILFVLSLLFVMTFSAQLLILIESLQPVEVTRGFAAASATFLTQSLLPLSIGDLGVRESAAAFFFSKIGVAPHAAFSAALLLFVINMLLPGMAGLFLLWKNPSKPQR